MSKFDYPYHELANLFPMMTAEEFGGLVDDIAENGLRRPIILYQAQVLDGRNRLRACEKAGIEPRFEEYQGDDPLGVLVANNVLRRSLTAGQRALIAVRQEPIFAELARKRQLDAGKHGSEGGRGRKKANPGAERPAHPKTRDMLAKIHRVNKEAIQQAKALLAESPDLVEQVDQGLLDITSAYEQLQERRKQARQKQQDLARIGAYRDAVDAGKLTLEQALGRVLEDEKRCERWLAELNDIATWIETHIATLSDEELEWRTPPPAHPTLANNITAKRLTDITKQLQRARAILFPAKKKTPNPCAGEEP